MTKISILTLLLVLASKLTFAQTDSTRTLDYYFKIVDSLELVEMKKVGIITDGGSAKCIGHAEF